MVFVWSHLTDGDPAYTLVQVSFNDLIMLLLFVPLVQFLVTGASSLTVPFGVLITSVIVFIVVPLLAGVIFRLWLVRKNGIEWFERELLPRFASVTIFALLAMLTLIFAFQADNITNRFFHVVLIAVPITLQAYFNSSLTYMLMRLLKVEYRIAAPGALIGASNFFELAVATAIALFGPESGAALATVVGVLVEVPVSYRSARPATARGTGFRYRMPEHGQSEEGKPLPNKERVLVLCTGNSARSQMAEGLLRHELGDGNEVFSAGTNPQPVRPEAIGVMRELAIDISWQRSKHVDEFTGQHFDYVLTVCDSAKESCPIFPGKAVTIHHNFEDPATFKGATQERLTLFRRVRDEMRQYLSGFPPSH